MLQRQEETTQQRRRTQAVEVAAVAAVEVEEVLGKISAFVATTCRCRDCRNAGVG